MISKNFQVCVLCLTSSIAQIYILIYAYTNRDRHSNSYGCVRVFFEVIYSFILICFEMPLGICCCLPLVSIAPMRPQKFDSRGIRRAVIVLLRIPF